LLDPLIRLAFPLMKAFAALVNLIFRPVAALVSLLSGPITRLLAVFKARP